jgi:hypothetical protein
MKPIITCKLSGRDYYITICNYGVWARENKIKIYSECEKLNTNPHDLNINIKGDCRCVIEDKVIKAIYKKENMLKSGVRKDKIYNSKGMVSRVGEEVTIKIKTKNDTPRYLKITDGSYYKFCNNDFNKDGIYLARIIGLVNNYYIFRLL